MLKDKNILITGGTGSFGRKVVDYILNNMSPKKLIIFSRDELKQFDMQQVYSAELFPSIRFFIGDIREKERLMRAMHGVNYVIHTAALKQVPTAEYNPFEAVRTNVIGTQNIINAAIECGVEKVVALSTDKAVNPVNLYGATKLCMEKLIIAGNSYAGGRTRFSVVRYGNVVGSRGSVIPLFLKQSKCGELTVTDERMTRFWITLENAVSFVLKCLKNMHGGEIFIPKISSMMVIDLAKTICPQCNIKITEIRPGEKLSEVLISSDESRHTLDAGDYFVILPEFKTWEGVSWQEGTQLPEGYSYNSSENDVWLSMEDMKYLIREK